jgi:iron-sulfur cluster repair protein YtfE (RIC family)
LKSIHSHGNFTIFSVVDEMRQVQNDQKENKSEQVLQIIGHVVTQFHANKRRQFVVANAQWVIYQLYCHT